MGQVVRKVSEIRTPVFDSTKKTDLELTQEQKQNLQRLDFELDREWFALKRKRHEVGRILSQINTILSEEGAFSAFLRSKRIARSTAYDLISDYHRWAKLPLPIRQAAERQEVDLSERKFIPIIKSAFEATLIDKLTNEHADNLVRKIDEIAKGSYREPMQLAGLKDRRRALMKAFEALHGLIGIELPANRADRLAELLNYAVHTYKLNPQMLKVKPEPPPSWLFTGVSEEEAE